MDFQFFSGHPVYARSAGVTDKVYTSHLFLS